MLEHRGLPQAELMWAHRGVERTSTGDALKGIMECMATPGPTTTGMIHRFASNMLQSARLERGWSQRELAAAAGVPQSMISRIESSQQQPTIPTLMRILAAADLDMRTRLEPYDDHDDVLDALHAARTPAQREAKEAAHAASVDWFTALPIAHRP